jgi:hypothetical protein
VSKQPQLCVNCGERPAMSSIGTAPLCDVCSPKASKRGVKLNGGKKPKPKPPV